MVSSDSFDDDGGAGTPAPTSPLKTDAFSFEHALAVVDGASGELSHSSGQLDRVFQLASVTKLFAAWGTLIAVENKVIGLADPCGPAGSTVRHLLAHASGLPFDQGATLAKPGERRIYSNLGIETVSDAVAGCLGLSVEEWLRSSVLEPLGMGDTTVPDSPATSGLSTVADLSLFAAELLRPSLISPMMASEATSVQFPRLSGVLPGYGRQADNRWGLGLEIRGHKQPHWTGKKFSARTFGHFGQSGSFIWVDPTVRKAGVFLGIEPFGAEHKEKWPALTEEMRGL
ncbi:MAG: serine hydrolase domain-containing protein [Ancrocorticia sp.]|uniref:serine hydrolase domain-containing protein n=1 Tax=Ancrocorticia sp. TaxID=2593684 RepID=UPI003F9354A4